MRLRVPGRGTPTSGVETDTPTITNFGGNVSYEPAHYYEPATEADVLAILDRHADGNVRVVASGHSWSPAIETSDTAIRMDKLNEIAVRRDSDGGVVVRAGGGAVLQDIVDAVESRTNHTLPTVGGILKQTISGAISTGTHGSGRPSLSHHMDEIRTAAYDPETGAARIYTYTEGDALRAMRCAVGRMGVILSVTFRCVPKYLVTETVTEVNAIADVLDRDDPDSLEQAILLPHSWRLLVFDRVVDHGTLSLLGRVRAAIHKGVSVVYLDVVLHLVVLAVVFVLSRVRGGLSIVFVLYGSVIPNAIRTNVSHTGPSTDVLTLRHDLFRHEEMELFIPKRNLVRATEAVTHIITVAAGGGTPTPADDVLDALSQAGVERDLERLRGTYVHHYLLPFRRVPQDDTLISMASGDDAPYYSLSFFTYAPPAAREPYYEVCAVIAKTLAVAFDARPHWGKHNPLAYEDVAHLYPRMDEFHRQCDAVDPHGTFSNAYTRRALGI